LNVGREMLRFASVLVTRLFNTQNNANYCKACYNSISSKLAVLKTIHIYTYSKYTLHAGWGDQWWTAFCEPAAAAI
jgi:hypothetical protein